VVAAIRGGEVERSRAWDVLARTYWKPVYKYLRLRWHADVEEASDLTQEFFARAVAKEFLAGFDPGRAHFRTFLRTCLDHLVQEVRRSQQRLKRGGGASTLSLDFTGAEDELARAVPPAPDRLDETFHQEWVRTLFEVAVDELARSSEAAGRSREFAAFRRYDIEAPQREETLTYADLAREAGVPVTRVTNWLHAMRARLRELVLAHLREQCASEDEFQAEARALFGGPRT